MCGDADGVAAPNATNPALSGGAFLESFSIANIGGQLTGRNRPLFDGQVATTKTPPDGGPSSGVGENDTVLRGVMGCI